MSKLKHLIPNFTWDLVATTSHDPEKVIFSFSSNKLSSSDKDSDKDLFSKGIRFPIPETEKPPWRCLEYSYLKHILKRILGETDYSRVAVCTTQTATIKTNSIVDVFREIL